MFSCRAVSAYFSSRPPVTIFTFSLLSLSLALMVLAGYCHYNTDLKDEVLDWPRLLQEMSELKYCLGNSSQLVETSTEAVETASLDRVPVLGDRDVSSGGTVPLSVLGFTSPGNLTVSLQMAGGLACVRVEAAELQLVSHLRNESVGQSGCWDSERKVRRWTAHKRRHLPSNWCAQSGEEQVEIRLGSKPGLETFLTQDQRDVMYYHLITTAILLLVCCLLVVVWAGVRRDTRARLTLLPTSDSEDM